MNMLSIIVVVYDFLERVVGFKALEAVEGLDPMGTNSNIGPSSHICSLYFSSLSIKFDCLFACCI